MKSSNTVNLGLFLLSLFIISTATAGGFHIANDGYEQLNSGKFVQCERYESENGVPRISLSIKSIYQLQGSKSPARDSYAVKNPDTGALEHQTGEPYKTIFGKMGNGGLMRSVPGTNKADYKDIEYICETLSAWVK